MATARSKSVAPTLVLLVRHGTTTTTGSVLPGRAPGLHLNDLGIEQAQAAADRIATLARVDAVYASPLERTQETARPIAKATQLRVRKAAGLLECDFGEWTGKKLSALRKLKAWEQVQRNPSQFQFPRGESFSDMSHRIWTELNRLTTLHPGGTVVAVSHADPIKAAIAQAIGTHLDLFQRIVVSPCSITPILFTHSGPIVLAVNTTDGSLANLQPS